ncbi:helix-turn-helix transcriptional regulator [Planktothrix sp. FACHB-1355]|uniref:Helix-turn-helix transcriptional regulator n=2 Tax=Cyanophyceae TaxID=3028117 RepID=A0A926VLN7_9CYAN|nr:helix-turn-helix transcriptional regulator [Aerosakkonema funiforme FACHB-1375]MBD3558570.1 helix-turn-helix transcriptional regulator [Planktothrix sp. FACHB-1355]
MIRNEREYRNTLYWLERFERSIAELDNNESLRADFKRWKLQRDSYQSQVEDLKEQIKEYETLTNHDSQTPIVLTLDEFNNLPQLLIKSRMAAKLSQKELAELAGLTEEEIQRYEDKDYEDASFLNVMAVVDALDIKIQSGEFLIPLDTLRRTPITKEELLSKSWQKVS